MCENAQKARMHEKIFFAKTACIQALKPTNPENIFSFATESNKMPRLCTCNFLLIL